MSRNMQLALEAMRNYLNAVNNTSYNGTLTEHVHWFFEWGGNWQDNISHYKEMSVQLLAIINKEDVSKLLRENLGSYLFELLPSLFYSVWKFSTIMDTRNFTTLFAMEDVETQGYSDEQLIKLQQEYIKKLEAISVTRGEKIKELIREPERTTV